MEALCSYMHGKASCVSHFGAAHLLTSTAWFLHEGLLVEMVWCNLVFQSYNASVITSLWKQWWVSSLSIAQPVLLCMYAIWVMFRAVRCVVLVSICEIALGIQSALSAPMPRTDAKRSPSSSVWRRSGISVTAIGFTLHKRLWIECWKFLSVDTTMLFSAVVRWNNLRFLEMYSDHTRLQHAK